MVSTPLQQIHDPLFAQKGVELWLKRDELSHPHIQGNKWRKLKYNLLNARHENHDTLLTFGGAYSNHIYATAAAGHKYGFKTIGIIRGEPSASPSDTLLFAASQGMKIYYLDRAQYLDKSEPESLQSLKSQLGDFYAIPEGGTNLLALQGCVEMVQEIKVDFDYITLAVGTGGTLAGVIAGLYGKHKVIGFSSLKGDDTLTKTVKDIVKDFAETSFSNWHINTDYHYGGYAKLNDNLVKFIKNFKLVHDIQLEPVYTGKMMLGLFDLIASDYFARGTRIVAIHTGGLQGLSGYKRYFE